MAGSTGHAGVTHPAAPCPRADRNVEYLGTVVDSQPVETFVPSATVDRPLLDWLKSRSEHQVTQILANRPDVLRPPWPRRLNDLALELCDYQSALRALHEVPLPGVQVLGSLQVADAVAGGAGVELESVVRLLEGADHDTVRRVITELLEPRALAWVDTRDHVFINERLRGATLEQYGLGLPAADLLSGLTMPELNRIAVAVGASGSSSKQQFVDRVSQWFADPENITAILRESPDTSREVLQNIAWNGPDHPHPLGYMHVGRGVHGSDPSGVGWALDRGLLVKSPESFGAVHMPLEVGLAIRGDEFALPFTPSQPALRSVQVDPELVTAESAAAALRMLDRVVSIVDATATEPIPLLKNGTIGVRAIKTLAKNLGATPDEARLAVDLASALELFEPTVDDPDDTPPRRSRGKASARKRHEPPRVVGLVPSDTYPGWRFLSSSARLCSLITTWLHFPRAPLADSKIIKDVLGDEPSAAFAHVRGIVLEQAAQMEGAIAEPGQLADVVRWVAPRLADELVDTITDAAVREATLLGALASGAASDLGMALTAGGASLTDSPDLVKAAEVLVAAARSTALFGPDLTAVVTGSADTDLAGLLDRTADREAQSAAMTWRFTTSSVRRAFDHGTTLEDLISDLSSVSSTGELPQPLTYLINDVWRRHGEASVIRASSVVVTIAEGLAAELGVHRKLAKLSLHQVAPTVLVSAADTATTLAALRDAGYAPAEMSPDGTPVLAVASSSASPPDHADTDGWPDDHVDASHVVGPDAVPSLADPARHALRLLNEPDPPARNEPNRGKTIGAGLRERHAGRMSRPWMQLTVQLDYGASAAITYREDDDTTTSMNVSAVDCYDDTLEVWCWDTYDYRDLDISRIEPAGL